MFVHHVSLELEHMTHAPQRQCALLLFAYVATVAYVPTAAVVALISAEGIASRSLAL